MAEPEDLGTHRVCRPVDIDRLCARVRRGRRAPSPHRVGCSVRVVVAAAAHRDTLRRLWHLFRLPGLQHLTLDLLACPHVPSPLPYDERRPPASLQSLHVRFHHLCARQLEPILAWPGLTLLNLEGQIAGLGTASVDVVSLPALRALSAPVGPWTRRLLAGRHQLRAVSLLMVLDHHPDALAALVQHARALAAADTGVEWLSVELEVPSARGGALETTSLLCLPLGPALRCVRCRVCCPRGVAVLHDLHALLAALWVAVCGAPIRLRVDFDAVPGEVWYQLADGTVETNLEQLAHVLNHRWFRNGDRVRRVVDRSKRWRAD